METAYTSFLVTCMQQCVAYRDIAATSHNNGHVGAVLAMLGARTQLFCRGQQGQFHLVLVYALVCNVLMPYFPLSSHIFLEQLINIAAFKHLVLCFFSS